jgi:8-hydroxy-5-deazaflavin:NADPH oxidoreductase
MPFCAQLSSARRTRTTRDAGYEPIYAGGLENAALLESFIRLVFAIVQEGLGPFFYRMAPPDQF